MCRLQTQSFVHSRIVENQKLAKQSQILKKKKTFSLAKAEMAKSQVSFKGTSD
jgi:hypothetical protein